MLIRPLLSQPQQITWTIDSEWRSRLRSAQPADVRLTDETFDRLEYEAWAYSARVSIHEYYAEARAVEEQVQKIKRRAKRALAGHGPWLAKLNDSLLPPSSPKTAGEKARLIAIDHLAVKFLTVERMRSGSPLTSTNLAQHAYECLDRQEWDKSNLERLCKYADQVAIEVVSDNETTRQSVQLAIGTLLIDGRPMEFRPDPLRNARIRPNGEALAAFARQLVLLYRWMGGEAKLHRLGTGEGAEPPTDFMTFLAAIKDAIPKEFRPKGDRLHSRARAFLDQEREIMPPEKGE